MALTHPARCQLPHATRQAQPHAKVACCTPYRPPQHARRLPRLVVQRQPQLQPAVIRRPAQMYAAAATAEAATAPEGAGADGIVFGKPQAPKEMYEGIARAAREGMVMQVRHMLGSSIADGDVVLATLHLASEDDAVKSRTHIPLPVDSFSQRLDTLAAEVKARMPAGLTPDAQLEFVTSQLYSVWGLKVAKSMEEGLYSPYRMYMHQVLAQRCGTQVACAGVLHSLLARLHASKAITWHAQVGLPTDPSQMPVARITSGSSSGSTQAVQWLTGPQLVIGLLDQLKRAYWSWDWPVSAGSGFEACARALSEAGRAGRVNAAVGVMQARGRPFGNVELALLSSERLCLITQMMDANSWEHQVQVRDYAAQLLHVGRVEEGLNLLKTYCAWLETHSAPAEAYKDLCMAVVAQQEQKLQQVGSVSSTYDEATAIIDPDRDA